MGDDPVHDGQRGHARRDACSDVVGRDGELRLVQDFVARLPEAGGALVISGEPGSGKTTLLAAAVREAQASGTRVLQAVGVQYRVQTGYERTLNWSVAHRFFIFIVFLISIVSTVLLFMVIPEDFLPTSDTGQILFITEAANGTSFDQMVKYQRTGYETSQAESVLDGEIDDFIDAEIRWLRRGENGTKQA